MKRDGGEPIEEYTPRQRGRDVPPADDPADDETRIIIKVGDMEVGSINPRTIKARAQFDIEDAISSATPATNLLKWLVQYAGTPAEALPGIKEELAEMSAWHIIELLQSIQEAVGRALRPPKGYKRR